MMEVHPIIETLCVCARAHVCVCVRAHVRACGACVRCVCACARACVCVCEVTEDNVQCRPSAEADLTVGVFLKPYYSLYTVVIKWCISKSKI
jgi:hypothetical protein